MIAYLRGAYTELTPTAVLVECAGVGYSVAISLTTYTALSGQKEGKILITEIIREDAHLLYGFATAAEQDLFRHLMTVSGVGPNTARIILSSYPPHELTSIITLGQIEPQGDQGDWPEDRTAHPRRPARQAPRSRGRRQPYDDHPHDHLPRQEGTATRHHHSAGSRQRPEDAGLSRSLRTEGRT